MTETHIGAPRSGDDDYDADLQAMAEQLAETPRVNSTTEGELPIEAVRMMLGWRTMAQIKEANDGGDKEDPCARVMEFAQRFSSRTRLAERGGIRRTTTAKEFTDLLMLGLGGHTGVPEVVEMAYRLSKTDKTLKAAVSSLEGTVITAKGCDQKECGRISDDMLEVASVIMLTEFAPYVTPEAVFAVARKGRHAGRARMTFDVRDGQLDSWLVAQSLRYGFSVQGQNGLNPNTRGQAVKAIVGEAMMDAPADLPHLFVRSAPWDGGYLIDIGDESGEFIKVTKDGWDVVTWEEGMPVFRKSDRPLPRPVRGATPDLLRQHLSMDADSIQWRTVRPWMATAFMVDHNRQILALIGTSGSGKTGRTVSITSVIDPLTEDNEPGAPPEKEGDFAVRMSQSMVPVMGNLNKITPQQSDWICQLVTGYVHKARKLHTNNESVTISLRRTAIMTGESLPAGLQNDAVNRVIPVELTKAAVRSEDEIRRERQDQKGLWLGALLDDMVAVLKGIDGIRLDGSERFSVLAKAAQILGPEYYSALVEGRQDKQGDRAFNNERVRAIAKTIADAISAQGSQPLELTALELLVKVRAIVDNGGPVAPKWLPGSPEGMKAALNKDADLLAEYGITFESTRSNKRRVTKFTYDPSKDACGARDGYGGMMNYPRGFTG